MNHYTCNRMELDEPSKWRFHDSWTEAHRAMFQRAKQQPALVVFIVIQYDGAHPMRAIGHDPRSGRLTEYKCESCNRRFHGNHEPNNGKCLFAASRYTQPRYDKIYVVGDKA